MNCQSPVACYTQRDAHRRVWPSLCHTPSDKGGHFSCWHRSKALEPIGGKKEVAFADFKKVMEGFTDTTPTKDIVNAFKVFDKDVRSIALRCLPRCTSCPPARRVCLRACVPACPRACVPAHCKRNGDQESHHPILACRASTQLPTYSLSVLCCLPYARTMGAATARSLPRPCAAWVTS